MRDIGALFDALKASFPMWNIESSEQNIALWHETLSGYTVSDLRRAYQKIMDAGQKSPPTLPEIKSLCRGRATDSQERLGTPIDKTSIEGPKVSERQAKENRDRLRRIMAGVEIDIAKHCVIGHLSNPMKRRFEESVNGYPTYNGHAIDPSFITKAGDRDRYIKEIEEWSQSQGAPA